MRSEQLVAEAGGQSRNPQEGKRPPFETATKQRLFKTEKTLSALVTVFFGVSHSVRLP
jgi:hypothetical protein